MEQFTSTAHSHGPAVEQLHLYARLLEHPVTYFGKHPARGTIGGWCPNEDRLVRAITHLSELGYDCFCNINPTRPVARKARRSDVGQFRTILCDLDNLAPSNDQLHWGRICGNVEAVLASNGVKVGCRSIIETGRGIHCYIHLTPLTLTSEEQRLQVEHATRWFLRGIAAALPDSTGARLDVTTSDLARVARCPGTINSRSGRMARIIEVASQRMPPSFTEELLRIAPGRRVPEPSMGAFSGNLFRLLPHLTETAQRFLCEGAPTGQRHHDAFATARSLREHGVPLEQALEWVRLGGSRCPEQLEPGECNGPVQSAYRQ